MTSRPELQLVCSMEILLSVCWFSWHPMSVPELCRHRSSGETKFSRDGSKRARCAPARTGWPASDRGGGGHTSLREVRGARRFGAYGPSAGGGCAQDARRPPMLPGSHSEGRSLRRGGRCRRGGRSVEDRHRGCARPDAPLRESHSRPPERKVQRMQRRQWPSKVGNRGSWQIKSGWVLKRVTRITDPHCAHRRFVTRPLFGPVCGRVHSSNPQSFETCEPAHTFRRWGVNAFTSPVGDTPPLHASPPVPAPDGTDFQAPSHPCTRSSVSVAALHRRYFFGGSISVTPRRSHPPVVGTDLDRRAVHSFK
jgi:hypothetical protein